MAFRFNAILDFNAKKAIQNMKLTKTEMQKLRQGGKRMGKGFGQIGQGAQSAALATAPFAIAVGATIREAANFEEQMSSVQSVLLASKEEMVPLNKLTKQLGATTAFSAKQAGEGAENLARAGFTTQQITQALPGVLDAAAASGVGLAEASDVVASNIGAFGLKASDATRVADILALTTARTNTNFTQLSEGLKLAAPVASQAGMSLSETASALGVFANAGIKGTLGATAMRSAINKLAKPTKESIKLFGGKKGMTAAMIRIGKDGKKQLKPMEVIMANVAKAVQGAKDPLQAAGQAAEIFGIRGTTAFSAFQKQLTETVPITDKNRKAIMEGAKRSGENIDEFLVKGTIPKLVALRLEIDGAAGSAKQMAAIKLDNLKGQFTLFKSALSGFGIEIGTLLTGPLRRGLKVATDGLSGIVAGFQLLSADGKEETDKLNKQMTAVFGEQGAQNVKDFIFGFVEGVKEVVAGVKSGIKTAMDFMKPFFNSGEDGAASFGKLAAKIILIGAIAAPILGAIAAGLFVLGPIITAISGVFNVLIGAFVILKTVAIFLFSKILLPLLAAVLSPIGLIVIGIMAVVTAIVIFRKEIWSAMKFAGRAVASFFSGAWEVGKKVFSAIGNFIAAVWNGMIASGKEFLQEQAAFFGGLFTFAKDTFNKAGVFISDFFSSINNGWVSFKDSAIAATTGVWDSVKNGAATVWTSIKSSFIDPMTNAVTGLPDLVMNKVNGAKNFIKDNVPGAGFFFGDDAEEPATGGGLTQADINAGTQSAKIMNESLRQKTVSAPASANDIGQATGKAVASSSGGASGGGTSNVSVTVGGEFRMRGRDLNMVVTKSQVEVAEKNGLQVNGEAKRKAKQNGQMMTGTGG